MRRAASCLVVVVTSVFAASAQQTAPKKQFEVASIKVAGPLDPQKILSGQQRVGMKQDAGRVDIENWSIIELLNAAYKISPGRLAGPAAPAMANMLTAQRFDIHATLPAGATKDDVPEMLQSLLAERWKLAFHNEKKAQDVYALVVGKNGSKLTPSPEEAAADPAANNTNRPDPISISGNPQSGLTVRAPGQGGATRMNMMPDGTMRLEAEKLTMQQLADALLQFVGKPVVDQTGLPGNYKIALELTREDLMTMARAAGVNVPNVPGAAAGPADPGGGASIFRSVENMGLKLEPKKLPVDYMVIDRLDKTPTED